MRRPWSLATSSAVLWIEKVHLIRKKFRSDFKNLIFFSSFFRRKSFVCSNFEFCKLVANESSNRVIYMYIWSAYMQDREIHTGICLNVHSMRPHYLMNLITFDDFWNPIELFKRKQRQYNFIMTNNVVLLFGRCPIDYNWWKGWKLSKTSLL